ncbi:hypothetical protein AV549_04765 [Salmonella enterica]|nr:hypothetical protein [Salmonella enterica]
MINPDDIQETITGLKKQHGHSMRSSTNGIPDFVPRRSQENKCHQAKSTHFIPDIPEQTPPPATNTVFSQADIDEFLTHKPKQYKMTARDYKELGRNIFLGAGDLISESVKGTIIAVSIIQKNKTSNSNSGWGYNSRGQYGYYGSHNWGITFDK